MAKALVTGGAGFIGSHLATRLVELGHSVRVIDDLSSGRRENLAHLGDAVELIEASICDRAACLRACADMDFVFHEAAIGSVPKSIEEPQASHDANTSGTFQLLRAAVQCKVRRLMYAGSSSVYGESEESPKHEGIMPAPLSPYAVQKLTGELYARSFYECFRLETISLRYFNVFGARQDPHGPYAAVIPAFVTAILKGRRPVVYGDGEQTRDFTHIDNVVHGNMLAMEMKRVQGQAVNVACGSQISVNQVIAAINRLLATNVEPQYLDPRPGDIRHSCADIRLARQLLGYEPSVDFDEGLTRAIDYYRSLVSS